MSGIRLPLITVGDSTKQTSTLLCGEYAKVRQHRKSNNHVIPDWFVCDGMIEVVTSEGVS